MRLLHHIIIFNVTLAVLALGHAHGKDAPFNSTDYTTTVNPRTSWGTWEGWGVSLCWWANVLGQRSDLADVVFTMKFVNINNQMLPGLGLNIARYNMGGFGERHIGSAHQELSWNVPKFKQIESFWQDYYSDDPASSSWDWTVDANQRSMLQMARDRGVDKFELFVNSPVWWMLRDHDPAGSLTGLTNNLEPWNFQNFTKYIVTVASHFASEWGINFTSVEAFNEPASLYWNAFGSQGGCHFDRSLQAWIIGLLSEELSSRLAELPQGLQIAASDEWHFDMAVETWKSFDKKTRAKVKKVNTHGYAYDSDGSGLYAAVSGDGKQLWNSEYGDGDPSGLKMASNINKDFQKLHPTAWCYWQVVDNSAGWGFFRGSTNIETIEEINMKHYVFAHYTRHVRPGMLIIDGGAANTVSAYDPSAHLLVLITLNYMQAKNITFDLSHFRKDLQTGLTGTRWVTNSDGSGDKYAKHQDMIFSGSSTTVMFAANTIQTIEIQGVYIDGDQEIII